MTTHERSSEASATKSQYDYAKYCKQWSCGALLLVTSGYLFGRIDDSLMSVLTVLRCHAAVGLIQIILWRISFGVLNGLHVGFIPASVIVLAATPLLGRRDETSDAVGQAALALLNLIGIFIVVVFFLADLLAPTVQQHIFVIAVLAMLLAIIAAMSGFWAKYLLPVLRPTVRRPKGNANASSEIVAATIAEDALDSAKSCGNPATKSDTSASETSIELMPGIAEPNDKAERASHDETANRVPVRKFLVQTAILIILSIFFDIAVSGPETYFEKINVGCLTAKTVVLKAASKTRLENTSPRALLGEVVKKRIRRTGAHGE